MWKFLREFSKDLALPIYFSSKVYEGILKIWIITHLTKNIVKIREQVTS